MGAAPGRVVVAEWLFTATGSGELGGVISPSQVECRLGCERFNAIRRRLEALPQRPHFDLS